MLPSIVAAQAKKCELSQYWTKIVESYPQIKANQYRSCLMARSGCIYGPTGSFKTAQVKWLAHYIARVTGKATLLLSLDGGGWDACQPEVDAGMIIPYRCETANMPLPLLRKISQGYWPEDTKETDPSKINLVPINYDLVGGAAVEGWTSIGATVMRYLSDNGINVGGEDRKKANSNMSFAQQVQVMGAWTPVDFGSNTRGDYNFILRFLSGFVNNMASLPLHYVLHTALEAKTEDEDRMTTYGPAIEGKKGTAQCGAWVGDLIHAQDYPVVRKHMVPDPKDPNNKIEQETVELTVRYYYRKHFDPATSIPFPAKPRVTPEAIADLEKRFPGGYFEPQISGKGSLGEYLSVVDELSAKAGETDTLKDWRQKMDAKLGRTPAAVVKAAS